MTQDTPRPREVVTAAVSGWEYECCGVPLRRGAIGRFTLTPWNDGEPPTLPEWATPVTYWLERHVLSDEPRHVRARVVRLWTWERGDGPAAHEQLDSMAGLEEGRPTAPGPGWIVELEVIEDLHPDGEDVPFDGLD